MVHSTDSHAADDTYDLNRFVRRAGSRLPDGTRGDYKRSQALTLDVVYLPANRWPGLERDLEALRDQVSG